MTYIQCLIISIIQGLTEFLPISSSAHIIFANAFYKYFTNQNLQINTSEEIFFAIIIHLGTLFAIFIYFKKEIIEIFLSFFEMLKNRKVENNNQKMSLFIIIGTIITVLIAGPLKDIVEKSMNAPYIASICLILTSFLLFFSEIMSKRNKNNKDKLTYKKSAIIGLSQGLAIFPGFSRSGFTIATGLLLGLNRVKSARFSFLLSVPIIIAASIFYPILEIDINELKMFNYKAIIMGFFTSATVGYLCIKYFLKFLNKYSLKVFAYYCFIVGIVTFLFFIKVY